MGGLLDSAISMLTTASETNRQNSMAQQKFDYNRYIDGMKMSLDVQKYVTNTGVKIHDMEMSDRKELFGSLNTRIDNASNQINKYEDAWQKAESSELKKYLRGEINNLNIERSKYEDGWEKLYPTDKMVYDAGQAGHDISGFQQEGDEQYGADLDEKEEKEMASKGSQGQQGGNGYQRGFDRSLAPTVRITQEPNQPARQEVIPSGIANRMSTNDEMPSNDGMQDVGVLRSQVQDLIGQVQNKLGGGQVDRQPLNIPSTRQTVEAPITDPYAGERTQAQRDMDKYAGEQYTKYEQESHERQIANLSRKSELLKLKGTNVTDELTRVENEMEAIQSNIVWAEDMMRRGRLRSYDPYGYAKEGVKSILGIHPKETSKVIHLLGGSTSKKDIAKDKNLLIAKQAEIDELNDIAEYEGTQGAIYTRNKEGGITGLTRTRPKQYKTAYGETREETERVNKRSSVYGGYR